MNSFTKIAMIPHRLWIVILMAIGLLVGCSPDDVLNPRDNDLPDLTDAIPWEALGSGSIVFQRTGPYPGTYEGVYVIDLDRKKSWTLQFSLANAYHVSLAGSKLLFNLPEDDFTAHLYFIHADGSHLTQVTFADGVSNRFVSWGR